MSFAPLSPLGFEPAKTLHAEAHQSVSEAAVQHNVKTVMDVAAEFSGLVAEMNRQEMTPAQLARLDAVFASFERILQDVRAIRSDLAVSRFRVR